MNNPPSDTRVFVLGCIGALAPEIVRLYKLRSRPSSQKFSLFYFVVTVFYALLGGIVALVLPAVTYQAALYAGITAPVTITAITRRKGIYMANEKPSQPPSRRSFKELLQTYNDALLD